MKKKVSIILPYYNRKELILNTLKSFEFFYSNYDNLEIIIVDDFSSENERLDNVLNFNLNIKLIRLKTKNGINPCYPYNVGVRNSVGDIIILSSPETFHTTNMFELTNNFENLNDSTYILMSVFCLTDLTLIKDLLVNFEDNIENFNLNKEFFEKNLGELGYSFNNKLGSWYLHSIHKPSGLNFLSAISRNTYFELSGFDERFRFGTGYDDDEFKERLLENNLDFIYYDNICAIHVNHEIVNNLPPTTNYNLFIQTKKNKYLKNNSWGIN
jgi:glycosyltransferase involved in cell wall biosynthesis